MHGPEIIARSITALAIPDKFENKWQYHSQSDRHSKIACWSIMFDLLNHCSMLREHIAAKKVGFGINLTLREFQTGREKDLDLVIATPSPSEKLQPRRGKLIKRPLVTYSDVAEEDEVRLEPSERALLDALPVLNRLPVGSVCVALETKAVMTAHVKALSRLHSELDSSHLTVHGHADDSVAAALVTVNFAPSFIAPNRNNFDLAKHPAVVNAHRQPNCSKRVIEKIAELRRRTRPNEQGFDAVGILLIELKNDGSPCRVVTSPPAPQADELLHYSAMIERICSQYRAKFQGL
jgi:hypothetical protein